MLQKFRKLLIGLVTLSLGLGGVIATESPSQAALDAKTFDPGLIISDLVFDDWGTMNATQIQKFLEARVPTCTDNDGGPKCLRNYKENISGSYAIRGSLHSYSLHICADVPAATNQSAAQIISAVATACRINPRVLLVTLQKEQGLVTAADPTTYMYKAAMGYGCPDSAPQICGQDSNSSSRLFWQMYRAGWQLRWYGDPRGSFTYLKPGKTINMGYHPSSSCGKKSFKLKSQATAKLYYYTPYTPNAAALNNLWGSGDSCSAYGNRNFWRQFWTWFGSPVAGSYIIKTSANETFLVNQDTQKRYKITDETLIEDFDPLGPVGSISESFMATFTDAGDLKSLVQDQSTQKRYLILDGFKYEVTTALQATGLGLDWANAPVLTSVQLSNFDVMAFGKSATSGEVFMLQGETKALVRDSALLKTLAPLGGTALMSDAMLGQFTLVDPVSDLLQDTAGLRYDIVDGKKVPVASSAVATALGFDWNNATQIATAQLAKVTTASFIKVVGATSTYLISEGKKRLVGSKLSASVSGFGSTATVTSDYLNRFPAGADLTQLLRTSATDYWYVNGSQKFKATTSQASAMGLDVNKAALVTTTQMATLSSPILMKATGGTTTYLVDGYLNKHPLDDADLTVYSSLGSVGTVPSAYLDAFTSKVNPRRFVNGDDGFHYYLAAGKRYRVSSAAVAAEYAPTTFTGTPSFAGLPSLSSTELTKYTVASTTKYLTTYATGTTGNFIVDDGKRREVLDAASSTAFYGATPTASVLGATGITSLPLGTPVISGSTFVKATDKSSYGLVVGNTYYSMPEAMFTDVFTSDAWNVGKSTGSLSVASLAKLTQGTQISPFVTNESQGYVVTGSGKQRITDLQNITDSITTLPTSVMSLINQVGGDPITTPIVVKDAKTSQNYVIANKVKRAGFDSEESVAISALQQSTTRTWPTYVLSAIKNGSAFIAPGTIVKVKESGNIYVIDGWARGLRLSSTVVAAFAPKTIKTVTRANLSAYNTLGVLGWQKVTCGSATYLMDAGKLTQIDASAVTAWPGQAVTLDPATCARYTITPDRLGLFVSNSKTKYKLVDGALKPIRTEAEYTALLGNGLAAVGISKSLTNSLPKLNPTSYVVVKGDTLYKVAVAFKTTRATLRTLNGLTTDVLRVGQVLRLP